MNTDEIKPPTHEEKIRMLEEIIKWGCEHTYNDLVRKTRISLEILRQNARVGERGLMTSFKGKHIQTVDEVKYILRILLKEICECPHKQKHIEGLRQAIINEEIAATAAQILQEEREALL